MLPLRPLKHVIQKGSLLHTGDLEKVVERLDRRIERIKKKLAEPSANTTILLDELHKANIYRDEFNYLKNQL